MDPTAILEGMTDHVYKRIEFYDTVNDPTAASLKIRRIQRRERVNQPLRRLLQVDTLAGCNLTSPSQSVSN